MSDSTKLSKTEIDQQVEQRVQEYALVPKEDREMSLSIYRQQCLFDALGLPKHYMFTQRIVLDDDGQTYKMVRREQPLEPIDFTLEDRHDVGGKVPTFSERSGYNASFTCHDHDEVLFNALYCSIEAKELM